MWPSNFVLLPLVVSALAVDPTVDLGYSKYKGTAQANNITTWRGIRYAAPPLGNLRFRKAVDPLVNSTIQIADTFGPQCLSTGVKTIDNTHSEDCLFLDVYAPSNAGAKKRVRTSSGLLPVFIFIQGGGFNTNSNPNLKGDDLITASGNNIVVVTFNYRVGPYGFLTSKEVQADGDLNVGLHDQRKVFKWVQNHISKFGGDPRHVTIGGDSAGAASVDLHLSAYGGRNDGLFHAAAAESQSFGVQFTVSGSRYQYDALAARTNCSTTANSLSCLRSLTAAQLQEQSFNIPTPGGGPGAPIYMYSNVIDGDFVQDFTYRLYAQGKFIKVPVIFGADSNDGTVFVPQTINSTASMNDFLQNQFPNLTTTQLQKIDSLYPLAEQFAGTGAYWRSTSNAYGDLRYMCPGLSLSSSYSTAGLPSWNYHYNVIDKPTFDAGFGVPHTVEVNAIWGPPNINGGLGGAPASYSPGGENANAVPLMQGYWTSFIRSFDPNTYRLKGSPEWVRWDASKWNRIRFETNTTVMETVDAGLKEKCQYLYSIGLALQQ